MHRYEWYRDAPGSGAQATSGAPRGQVCRGTAVERCGRSAAEARDQEAVTVARAAQTGARLAWVRPATLTRPVPTT